MIYYYAFEQTLASLISDLAPNPALAVTLSGYMHELLADEDEHPFMTRTVRQMLFEGWSLTPYVKIVEFLYDAISKNLTDTTLPPLPNLPDDPKFGFFYGVGLCHFLNCLAKQILV